MSAASMKKNRPLHGSRGRCNCRCCLQSSGLAEQAVKRPPEAAGPRRPMQMRDTYVARAPKGLAVKPCGRVVMPTLRTFKSADSVR